MTKFAAFIATAAFAAACYFAHFVGTNPGALVDALLKAVN